MATPSWFLPLPIVGVSCCCPVLTRRAPAGRQGGQARQTAKVEQSGADHPALPTHRKVRVLSLVVDRLRASPASAPLLCHQALAGLSCKPGCAHHQKWPLDVPRRLFIPNHTSCASLSLACAYFKLLDMPVPSRPKGHGGGECGQRPGTREPPPEAVVLRW